MSKKDEIVSLWKRYKEVSIELKNALGRSANISGEFGEYLASIYYQGNLMPTSNKGFDVQAKDGRRIQVKSATRSKSTPSLSDIRDEEFDVLFILEFNEQGDVNFAGELDQSRIPQNLHNNSRTGAGVICLTKKFKNQCVDVTDSVKRILQ